MYLLDPNSTTKWRHTRQGTFTNWESNFVKTFGPEWATEPMRAPWSKLHTKYVAEVLSRYDMKKARTKAGQNAMTKSERGAREEEDRPANHPQKKARILEPERPLPWGPDGERFRLAIFGDSKNVVDWANATTTPDDKDVRNFMGKIHRSMSLLIQSGIRPVVDSADLFHHIYREHNTLADSLTYYPMNGIHMHIKLMDIIFANRVTAKFDGGFREGVSAAIAWHINVHVDESDAEGIRAVTGSWEAPPTHAIDAELAAAASLLDFLVAMRQREPRFVKRTVTNFSPGAPEMGLLPE